MLQPTTTLAMILALHSTLMNAAASRAQRVAPTHADGEFCPVHFALNADGDLRTYTYRGLVYAMPARSLVKTLIVCDDRDWHIRFIDTEFIGLRRMSLPQRVVAISTGRIPSAAPATTN